MLSRTAVFFLGLDCCCLLIIKRTYFGSLRQKGARQIRHLDLACGRGGDIQKWSDARMDLVLALDISDSEIQLARQRLAALQERRGGDPLHFRFAMTADLGLRSIDWRHEFDGPVPPLFDSVSVMFAAHYFFASRDTLQYFLANVSAGLRVGGFFYGTVPVAPVWCLLCHLLTRSTGLPC